jgi:hypothetical protein
MGLDQRHRLAANGISVDAAGEYRNLLGAALSPTEVANVCGISEAELLTTTWLLDDACAAARLRELFGLRKSAP